MMLQTITLLTDEEYEKYKPHIPSMYRSWWLQAPGSSRDTVCTVDYTGNINSDAYTANCIISVRPVLVFDLDMSDPRFWYRSEKLAGQKFEYGKYTWTFLDVKLGKMSVICDSVIAKRCFDPESNNWDKSELKSWLETEGLKLITP